MTGQVVSTFEPMRIMKSWVNEGVLYREGWFSTPDRDRQKDITEPEAFLPVLKSYFERSAPVTNTHDTIGMPIGHLQRGAILRDGKVLASEAHPTDPAEFTTLPVTGSGFYGRLAINDPIASYQVQKGNLGGCSFIAYASKLEALDGGGHRFLEFDELMETTIAAFPVNPKAVLRVAKAYGYDQQEEILEMTKEEIEAMIAGAMAPKAPEVVVVKAEPTGVTLEQFTAGLSAMTTSIMASVDTQLVEVKKGYTDLLFARDGVGRKGDVSIDTEMDTTPAEYIVKKSQSGEPLTQADKDLIGEITLAELRRGMDY